MVFIIIVAIITILYLCVCSPPFSPVACYMRPPTPLRFLCRLVPFTLSAPLMDTLVADESCEYTSNEPKTLKWLNNHLKVFNYFLRCGYMYNGSVVSRSRIIHFYFLLFTRVSPPPPISLRPFPFVIRSILYPIKYYLFQMTFHFSSL